MDKIRGDLTPAEIGDRGVVDFTYTGDNYCG